MKKIFVYMALASLTLTACHTKEFYEKDGIPIEPEPEPEIVYEGEGNLEKEGSNGVAETNSTYTWKAEGTTILIDAYIDTGQYIHGDDEFGGGEYCIGWFTLPIATMNEFFGVDVRSELTEANFYPVDPDGSKVTFSSYKPGMWVDADGATSNWSAGSAFWQWYVWEGQGSSYDMSQSDYPGIIYLGCQPANAAAVAGKTVTSKAKIEVNGTTYDWTVNFHYAETEAVVEGSGKLSKFVWDDDDNYHIEESLSNYRYTLAAESGLEIFVEVNTEEWTDSGDWMIGWFDLPRAQFKEVAGFDPAELDESTFYALDDFGDPVEEMTSYKPGMWVDENGLPAPGWSEGVAYWQWYVWGGKTDKNGKVIGYDYDYEKHPDIFVVGGNPGNVSKVTFEEPFSTTAMMKGAGKEYPVTITYTFQERILPETEGYPEGRRGRRGHPVSVRRRRGRRPPDCLVLRRGRPDRGRGCLSADHQGERRLDLHGGDHPDGNHDRLPGHRRHRKALRHVLLLSAQCRRNPVRRLDDQRARRVGGCRRQRDRLEHRTYVLVVPVGRTQV